MGALQVKTHGRTGRQDVAGGERTEDVAHGARADLNIRVRYSRGQCEAAASPALRAAVLEDCGISRTVTPSNRRAIAAVSSVQPLQATMTSKCPAAANGASGASVRAITEASLWAGIITEPWGIPSVSGTSVTAVLGPGNAAQRPSSSTVRSTPLRSGFQHRNSSEKATTPWNTAE